MIPNAIYDRLVAARPRAAWLVPVIIALTALPLLYLLLIVALAGVDVPNWDQWELVLVLEKMYTGTLTFADLWAQHNEHRILFPRLIMLALAHVSQWNIRYELAVNLVLGMGIFLVVMQTVVRTTRAAAIDIRTSWLLPVLSLLIFSLRQNENWLWGWQLQIFLNVLCAAWGLMLLATPPLGWRHLFQAALLGIVATYSFANGMIFWLIGAVLVGIMPMQDEKKRWARVGYVLAWIGISAAICVSYLYQYHKPEAHPSLQLFLQEPAGLIKYTLTYIAAPVTGLILENNLFPSTLSPIDIASLCQLVGLLGIVALSAACWQLMPRGGDRFYDLTPYLALAAYALFSAAVTGIGRQGFGVEQACSARYITIANLFWIALVVLLQLLLARTATRWKRNVIHTTVGVLVVLLLSTMGQDTRKAFDARDVFLAARQALCTQEDSPLFGVLYPRPEEVTKRARILKQLRLSVFREPLPAPRRLYRER